MLSDAFLSQAHRFMLYGLLIVMLFLVWRSRYGLLYEDGNLSLGRVWGWIAFGIAAFFWLRHTLGIIPPGTEFPPGLQEMLYALLVYNLFKHSRGAVEKIADIWSSRKYGKKIERADEFHDVQNHWENETPRPVSDTDELRINNSIEVRKDG